MGEFTLLADSLPSFLDKLGKRKATLPTSSNFLVEHVPSEKVTKPYPLSSPGLASDLCHFFVACKFPRLIFMLAVLYFNALVRHSKLLRVANEHFFGITSYSSISQNSGQEGR